MFADYPVRSHSGLAEKTRYAPQTVVPDHSGSIGVVDALSKYKLFTVFSAFGRRFCRC
jgi:hypothetical protein